MDWSLIVAVAWGIATVAAYARVVQNRRLGNDLHHDRRSRRDLLSAVGLFLVATLASLAVVFDVLDIVGPHDFASALSVGGLTAVGFLMATEHR